MVRILYLSNRILLNGFVASLNHMVKKAGDGKGADTAFFGSNGGEVGAGADGVGDIAFDNAFF